MVKYEKTDLHFIKNNNYFMYNNIHYKLINSEFIKKDSDYELDNGYTFKLKLLNLDIDKIKYFEITTRCNITVNKYDI